MTKDGPQVCRPCRESVHLECDGTKEKPCGCMICATFSGLVTHTEFDLERKAK